MKVGGVDMSLDITIYINIKLIRQPSFFFQEAALNSSPLKGPSRGFRGFHGKNACSEQILNKVETFFLRECRFTQRPQN